MEWVKLYSSYYHDLVLAMSDDAAEVMFTRGLAFCGRAETGGFIPVSQLNHLTRWPMRAKRIAAQLTREAPDGSMGPWEVVDGGYRVRNWGHFNGELDALSLRRKSDRVRKQRQRAKDHDSDVTGQSRDGHVDGHAPKSKREKKTAAAAAGDAAAAVSLPTSIDILATKLRANTALQGLRFDGLAPDRAADLDRLITLHGDAVLVDVALRTCRTPPPVHVSAFIGTWAALPEPGQRLKLVDEPMCTVHDAQREPAARCRYCAADRLAGDA